MVADVETMAFKGQVPWHGRGNRLRDPLSIPLTLEDAGADWTVSKRRMVLQEDPGIIVPGYAVVRDTDNKPLGTVGEKYMELQNRAAFDFFKPFVETGGVRFETAGVLSGGKYVWILAELLRDPLVIGKDDTVKKFILLSNSHDGTRAVSVGFTPVRVVCANTLARATGSNLSSLIRIRHSGSVQTSLEKVRETMDLIDAEFVATGEQYAALQRHNISVKDLRKYVRVLFNHGDTPDDKLTTLTKNKIAAVEAKFENDRQRFDQANGTWWAAYNAYTEWLNYNKGRSVDTRLKSLWFDGSDNRKALELALQLGA